MSATMKENGKGKSSGLIDCQFVRTIGLSCAAGAARVASAGGMFGVRV